MPVITNLKAFNYWTFPSFMGEMDYGVYKKYNDGNISQNSQKATILIGFL